MSDRADMRGPVTRRSRTTVSGGGGAASAKQVNGSKSNDAGDKPPQHNGKARTENEAHNHTNKNGKVERQTGQHQLTNMSKKQRSVVEDINEKLR